MVNTDAVTAGAFPDALDEDDQPGWLVRDVGLVESHDANDGSTWGRFEYDLASQRLFRNQQETLMFIIGQTSSGQSLVYHLFTRVLVKDA